MHWLTLEFLVGDHNLKKESSAIWCDNISSVSWVHKFQNSNSIIATSILRKLAARIHHCRGSLLSVDHINGIFNILADVVSQKHTTNLTEFLHFYTNKFPPPQGGSWHLFQHSTKFTLKICSELLPKTSKMESWRRLTKKGSSISTIGNTGSACTFHNFNQIYDTWTDPAASNCLWPTEDMLGTETFHLTNTKFAPEQLKWHFEPSARRSHWTENFHR